jgi:uncharacterized protein (DUF433 family)
MENTNVQQYDCLEISTENQHTEKTERTEHPYIVKVRGVCGGEPTIEGSRVAVRNIAVLYKAGWTMDEICNGYEHLPAAAIYDAVSYYLDHQAEIERHIYENRIEYVMQEYNLVMDEQGVLHDAPVAQSQQQS